MRSGTWSPGAMMSTGQKCTATSRAIVDRRIVDRFTEMLADRIGGLKVGDPLDAETQIGPLIDEQRGGARRRRSRRREAGGRRAGRRAASDWAADWSGARSWRRPCSRDVDPKSRLGQDELFGPVLGVIPVDSMEEAMAVANQVKFGLSASIFTRDLGRALAFAREIEAGIVHVNSETAGAEPQVPFGGMKGVVIVFPRARQSGAGVLHAGEDRLHRSAAGGLSQGSGIRGQGSGGRGQGCDARA